MSDDDQGSPQATVAGDDAARGSYLPYRLSARQALFAWGAGMLLIWALAVSAGSVDSFAYALCAALVIVLVVGCLGDRYSRTDPDFPG